MAASRENASIGAPPYTLYHNFWSSCSLMLRFSLFLSKDAKDATPIPYKETEIDIQHGAQVNEFFMCEVNPKGQVPALTHPIRLSEPIIDSLDITNYLFQFYPNLCPPQFSYQINKYLRQLHGINFFTLSFFKYQARGESLVEATLVALNDPSISPKFRSALESKLEGMSAMGEVSFLPQTLSSEEKKTAILLKEIGQIRDKHQDSSSPWIFGTVSATALDAHLAVFLARLNDVGRSNLIQGSMASYADDILGLPAWKDFMQGRTTMYSY